jgi:hypothetical protein
MKVPPQLFFRKELSLILWKPQGILSEAVVNELVAFIETAERRSVKPFDRFYRYVDAGHGGSELQIRLSRRAVPPHLREAETTGQVGVLRHQ